MSGMDVFAEMDFSGIDISEIDSVMPSIGNLASENKLIEAIRGGGPPNEVARLLRAGTSATGNSDYDDRYMSHLERAVAELAVGVAVQPFQHGALPEHSKYAGELLTIASMYGTDPMEYLPGYTDTDSDTVPGMTWDGLVQLARCYDGHDRMVTALCVMELAARHMQWVERAPPGALPISKLYAQHTAALAGCAPDAATTLASDTRAVLRVLAAMRNKGQLPGDSETFAELQDAMVGTLMRDATQTVVAELAREGVKNARGGSGGSVP